MVPVAVAGTEWPERRSRRVPRYAGAPGRVPGPRSGRRATGAAASRPGAGGGQAAARAGRSGGRGVMASTPPVRCWRGQVVAWARLVESAFSSAVIWAVTRRPPVWPRGPAPGDRRGGGRRPDGGGRRRGAARGACGWSGAEPRGRGRGPGGPGADHPGRPGRRRRRGPGRRPRSDGPAISFGLLALHAASPLGGTGPPAHGHGGHRTWPEDVASRQGSVTARRPVCPRVGGAGDGRSGVRACPARAGASGAAARGRPRTAACRGGGGAPPGPGAGHGGRGEQVAQVVARGAP